MYEQLKKVVAGIYMITEVETDRVYVGSANGKPSNGIKKRWTNHKWNIEQGHNKYFDDISKVRFEILELVPNDTSDEYLAELETYYFTYVERVGFTLVNKNKNEVTRKSPVKDKTNMKKAQGGSNNPNCKLTIDEAREIMWLKENGYKQKWIAEKYDVSATCVYRIGNVSWAFLNKNDMKKPEWIEEER